MSITDSAATYVKVNRLKDGWTSNVSVAAENNSLEALTVAKERALTIIRELKEELNPIVITAATEEEIPY